jgi:two-component system heavy metal sensor histidine kinase CusS
VLLGSEDQLLLEGTTASGRHVILVVGMHRFAIERAELLRATGISLATGILLAMLVSAVATRRALRPLRAATRATEEIDLDRLDARLPLRGTGDDVDRHAAAVNRVLDRLEAGFQRIQDFNHDVAHELRTPINRILNAAEVSLLAGRAEPEMEHALEVIRDSAEGMGQVVEALLLLAREGEGSLGRRAVLLRTAELFEALERVYAPVFDEKGVRLEIGRGMSAVRGDETLLLRALSNLLDNAIRHTPRGGSVRLEETVEPESVCVRVSDSGPGVAEGDRERIFWRLVRLDGAIEPGGAGLGLPIARMIARVHGGGLDVESSPLSGACFALRLPRPLTSC